MGESIDEIDFDNRVMIELVVLEEGSSETYVKLRHTPESQIRVASGLIGPLGSMLPKRICGVQIPSRNIPKEDVRNYYQKMCKFLDSRRVDDTNAFMKGKVVKRSKNLEYIFYKADNNYVKKLYEFYGRDATFILPKHK
ncbi:MAG: hypothetical protein Q7S74_05835 [Nanoarchaeota archaeon]|nr:hypothetical protein [Nanoarchaeota archaeon]